MVPPTTVDCVPRHQSVVRLSRPDKDSHRARCQVTATDHGSRCRNTNRQHLRRVLMLCPDVVSFLESGQLTFLFHAVLRH